MHVQYICVNTLCGKLIGGFQCLANHIPNGEQTDIITVAKVSGAGVWTDGATRFAMQINDDADNRYYVAKLAANNTFRWLGEAGNGAAVLDDATSSSTDWVCVAETWSDSNNDDQFKAYENGAQNGATSADLNAWGGAGLSNTQTVLGATDTALNNPWSGYLAHLAVFDYVLSAAEILDLATV